MSAKVVPVFTCHHCGSDFVAHKSWHCPNCDIAGPDYPVPQSGSGLVTATAEERALLRSLKIDFRFLAQCARVRRDWIRDWLTRGTYPERATLITQALSRFSLPPELKNDKHFADGGGLTASDTSHCAQTLSNSLVKFTIIARQILELRTNLTNREFELIAQMVEVGHGVRIEVTSCST